MTNRFISIVATACLILISDSQYLIAEQSCQLIGRGPGIQEDDNSPEGKFGKKVLNTLKMNEWLTFHTLFHPRAKVKKSIGDRTKAILDRRYKSPIQFSVYGIWKFHDTEKKKDLYQCDRAENMKLISHYGYENQYMMIVQILSKNELGRLIFSFAKSKGEFFIIGFHIQQWSHSGEPWDSWVQKGNSFLSAKNHKSAYIYYDIGQKLLDGGSLVSYDYRKETVEARNSIFSQNELLSAIQLDSEEPRVVYSGTLLGIDSKTGIFLRVALEKEYNSKAMQDICTNIGRSLFDKKWLDNIDGGVNCSFIPKGADPLQNSKIGGYYIDRETIEKKIPS